MLLIKWSDHYGIDPPPPLTILLKQFLHFLHTYSSSQMVIYPWLDYEEKYSPLEMQLLQLVG